MLILPIKKKWFDMILSGEKKEEYREIKPYYTARLINALGRNELVQGEKAKRLLLKSQAEKQFEVLFRNGYSSNSPNFIAVCHLNIGQGKEKWGAVSGVEYYILTIDMIKQSSMI